MPVNSTHPDYDASLPAWLRARDVIAGEDAVKSAGVKYLPRLDSQSDNEYLGYKSRACFFNATSRTCDGFLGLLFRRDPEVKLPDRQAGVGGAIRVFTDDVDLMGTSLFTFCKGVVGEILAVGRCGTLIDWQSDSESRAYVVRYVAEDILNWQTQRINGRNVVTLIALREVLADGPHGDDPFVLEQTETIRVLKLESLADGGTRYVVELWILAGGHQANGQRKSKHGKLEWKLQESRVPLRLGKPLPLIPFVFHGPRNSLPDVDKMPLADIISVNLDHYRLDADYKHGLHFTALPTAWVSGFDKTTELRIGSSTAWVSDTVGAVAGFLEFKGHGLSTFENAQDRDERLMAVLGSRMLEDTKRVGETADAIELRQAGENSILMTLALSVSDSISQVLRWVYWWNSTEQFPEDVSEDLVLLLINTDFTAKGLTSLELTAIVSAWQAGAISQATMFDLFRKGEVLPTGRTDSEEKNLISQNGRENPTGGLPNGGTTPAATTPPAAAKNQ
ncbi:MAG: DUF4055 domain-containing protein [Verrucomicrobiales bacterium]|nr:DUF4055 domain-containing protein [Verrucomicrobiales bacterium]